MLLVLDNFEHVLGAAQVVTNVLATCARLKILVTSRAPLQLGSEHRYAVPPLPIPVPADAADINVLAGVPSVALFSLRARAVESGWQLTKANASAVIELCRRLDGLPLEIELAAAWVHPLGGARAVLARLEVCLDEQGSARQDQPTRHRTLRAAIGWSYDLLTDEEKAVFERLSVFAGGCTLEAAAAVCARSLVEMLGTLRGLVDKHLVQSLEQRDGETRFQMLVTLQGFAQSHLEAAGAEDAHLRHAEFFANLAGDADQRLNGPAQREWLDRLEREYDNIRGALNRSVERNRLQLALRLAGALWFFWDMRGHLREGRQKLAQLIAHPAAQMPTAARVMALNAAGWTALVQGDYATSVGLHEEAVVLSEQLQEPGLVCRSTMHLAVVLGLGPQELDRAEALYAECEPVARDMAEELPWVIRLILYGRGHVAALRGDMTEADKLWGECVSMCEASGNMYALSYIQFRWGVMAIQNGALERARNCLYEAVRFASEIDCAREMGVAMDALGWVAVAQGGAADAARLFGAAATLLEHAGYNVPPFMLAGHEQAETAARQKLGERLWTVAREDGRRLTRDEALALARADSETYMSPGRPGRRASKRSTNQFPLTPRELEVAYLVGEGLTNRQIAQQLGIGERTVIAHLEHAFIKLGVQTRAQVAVRVAAQLGASSAMKPAENDSSSRPVLRLVEN